MVKSNKLPRCKYFTRERIRFLAEDYSLPILPLTQALLRAEQAHDKELKWNDKDYPSFKKQAMMNRKKYKTLRKATTVFLKKWQRLYVDNSYKNFAVRLAMVDRRLVKMKNRKELDAYATVKNIDIFLNKIHLALKSGEEESFKVGKPQVSSAVNEVGKKESLSGLHAFTKVMKDFWQNELGRNFGQGKFFIKGREQAGDKPAKEDVTLTRAQEFLEECVIIINKNYTLENCSTAIRKIKKGTGRGRYVNPKKRKKN